MTAPRPSRSLLTLGEQEALELVASVSVGRLGHMHGDQLYIAPVNFLLDGRDVLVRTEDGTTLLEAAGRNGPAALEVDDLVRWSRSGWSVLIRGRLSEETDPEQIRRVLKSTVEPWAGGERDHVLRLAGEQITGRRIEPGPGGVLIVEV